MKRVVVVVYFSVLAAFGTNLQHLYEYMLSKNPWQINGWFYRYDFEKNGYEFNDWLYLVKSHRAYRLLGITPTPTNVFGWLPLLSIPQDLSDVAGYFIFLDYPLDPNRAFSWIYLSKEGGIYKLEGADPNTHFFKYLDIDNDGKADSLPGLIYKKEGDRIYFEIVCDNLPGLLCSSNNQNDKNITHIDPDPLKQNMLYPGHYPGMYAHEAAFAALREDGRVITWGNPDFGGDSEDVQDKLVDVKAIYTTSHAFAALREDGSVVTWGDADEGGDSSSVQDRLQNVRRIYSTYHAFAALREDGSVVTWGDPIRGGDSSSVQDRLKNVSKIYATSYAFAALKKDGEVVTWGDPDRGGDSSEVQDSLNNIKVIYSNSRAFAAVKKNGKVVSWGDYEKGSQIDMPQGLKNVVAIYSSARAFAALKSDGTVVTWGRPLWGGDSKDVQDELYNIVGFSPSYIKGAE